MAAGVPVQQWYGVAWSPALSLFAAVSSSGTNHVITSPDGITWTLRSALGANGWKGIAWSPALGLFAAVCSTVVSSTQRIMTSPDGIIWTMQNTPNVGGWASNAAISWDDANGVFCAVGGAVGIGVANHVITSGDGVNWAFQTIPQDMTLVGIGYGGAGMLVAGGLTNPASTNEFITSTDGGVTWAQQTSPNTANWGGSIFWAAELGKWMAGAEGNSPSTDRFAESPDGLNWTGIASPLNGTSKTVSAISYDPSRGIFLVGMTNAPTTNNLMFSDDGGATWQFQPSPGTGFWAGIAYSPTLERSVIVGDTAPNVLYVG